MTATTQTHRRGWRKAPWDWRQATESAPPHARDAAVPTTPDRPPGMDGPARRSGDGLGTGGDGRRLAPDPRH
ncbi:MAG TPA: hypothetical protein VFL91_09140 [Thermomicrobiales bacterium]|nr:hypothetical protein [Thermomicrobiales bacterium]